MFQHHRGLRTGRILLPLPLIAACAMEEVVPDPPPAAAAAPAPVSAVPAPPLEDPRPAFLPGPVQPRDAVTLELPGYLDAVAELGSGQPRAAAIRLEDLRRRMPRSRDLLMLHGLALLEAGNAGAAERLAGADPGGDPFRAWLAGRSRLQQGRAAAACEAFRVAAAAFPRDADVQEEAAGCGDAAGEAHLTLACLERRALLGPLSARLQRLRARALVRSGETAEGMEAYERLLAAAPEDAALWEEAGLAAFRAAREGAGGASFSAAARRLEEAADLDPQNPRHSYNLGCALDWGGDSTGAEEAYLRALELDPGYVKPAENLAELRARAGRIAAARQVLTRLLRQPLSAEEVTRLEERLRGLAAPGPAVPEPED